MDYSLPGSSVHEIFQARILEWVAIPFSRGSSPPRIETWSATLQVERLFPSFLWLSSTPVCVCVCVYCYLYAFLCSGHLGYFCTLAIVNTTAMNTEVHASFEL